MSKVLLDSTGSMRSQGVDLEENEILSLLRTGRLSLEQILERVEGCEKDVVSSVSKLITGGFVRLVSLQYPWGIEFDLEATAKSAAT